MIGLRPRVASVALFRRQTPGRRQVGLRVHEPVSTQFGLDRGRPVDRFYIERFLQQNRDLIRGRVLEVQERTYIDWFGTGVEQADVLHAGPGNAEATIIGDLTTGEGIPIAAYDCFIATQTLPFIYDVHAAVKGMRDALAPGGVLLASVPGISQTSRDDARDWGDWWRFTAMGTRRLFGDVFGEENVEVQAHGNVMVAAAFLYGHSADEFEKKVLESRDDDYDFLMTVRAVRPPNAATSA
jgi:hypothetical protein